MVVVEIDTHNNRSMRESSTISTVVQVRETRLVLRMNSITLCRTLLLVDPLETPLEIESSCETGVE